jgi:chemotaxis response regulator CheB
MPTSALIADDRRRSRSGLRAVLALRPEIELVGEAVDGQEALRLLAECRPDVVLMDTRMPVMASWSPPTSTWPTHPMVGTPAGVIAARKRC